MTGSSCLRRAFSDWLSQKQFPVSCSCLLAGRLNVSLTSCHIYTQTLLCPTLTRTDTHTHACMHPYDIVMSTLLLYASGLRPSHFMSFFLYGFPETKISSDVCVCLCVYAFIAFKPLSNHSIYCLWSNVKDFYAELSNTGYIFDATRQKSLTAVAAC